MTSFRKFCTGCGAPLAGTRFCTRCGQPVPTPVQPATGPAPGPVQPAQPAPVPAPATGAGGERILGIVPFLEQGLISVIHYTLVITDRQLIFCTWDPANDEAMSDADDAVMQESCSISDTKDEIAHFRQKDWSGGPWERYRSMTPDSIAAVAPGSITVPLAEIADVSIICETLSSTQDTLRVRDRNREISFDLMHSQGPYLARILAPLLGERLSMEDHLHRRRGLDRLLSGQEYR